MGTSVAIGGLAPWSQVDIFDRGGYDEIWAINNGSVHYDYKPDLIIAMDDFDRDMKHHEDYVLSIVNAGVPVLSTEDSKRWPNVKAYPLKRIAEFLGPNAPWILDNTCNYALALALADGHDRIGVFGIDWCHPYDESDLECAHVRWRHKGYGHAPDWFKYYERDVVAARRHTEPGGDSFHYLMGLAKGMGVEIEIMGDSTLLNRDRDRFFYGYQDAPNV